MAEGCISTNVMLLTANNPQDEHRRGALDDSLREVAYV